MYDIFESFIVGSELEAHGKKWFYIKHIKTIDKGDFYLAAEIGAHLPAPAQVIFVEKKKDDTTHLGGKPDDGSAPVRDSESPPAGDGKKD